MKILFAVSNENVSNRIVESYKKRYDETVSSKNVFYFNAILRELQRDKTYDSIVISEDLEPFANSNYDVIDKFIVERLQEVSQEINRIGKDIAVVIICTDRRTKTSYVLNKLYEFGIYNALVGADRRIDNVCNLINTPRTQLEAKEYYNIQEDELGNNLDDVSEQEVQNILIHYKKLGKNEDRYTDSFNNIASQYNDKQLRIIIKCLPINVRAVLESECPKYQELVTTQDETEEERKQKEILQEQRKAEKAESDKKLQAKIEKERREAEKRALKEQKAAEKAAARAANNQPQNQMPQAEIEPEPTLTSNDPGITESVAPASIPSYSTPKTNAGGGSTGIDLLDRKKKEPRMTGNVIIPGNMNIASERKLYSDEELENMASTPRQPAAVNAQMTPEENASPVSMPENNEVTPAESVLPGMGNVAPTVEPVESVLPGMEDVAPTVEPVESVLPGMEDVAPTVEPVESVLPGMENVAPTVEPVESVLPGMEDVAPTVEPVESVLPGMENVAPTVEPVESVLPGMEDVAPTVEPVESILPGMENVAPTVEPVESVLPGMENIAPTVEPVESVLPGMEDVAPTVEPVESVLPGMEDVAPAVEPVESILPGMEDVAPTVEPVESILPGMESVAPTVEPVESVLPGMEDVAPTVEPVDSVLPGMENVAPTVEPVQNVIKDSENEVANNDLLNIDQTIAEKEQTPEQTTLDAFNNIENAAEEPKKRGRGRPRKYPVEPPKPKGKRGRPRKNPLPEEVAETAETVANTGVELPGFEQVTEAVPSVQLPESANVNVPDDGKVYIQTPTGPIAVEKEEKNPEETDMTGFEDVAVSNTYVEKVTADNIEVPEEPEEVIPEINQNPEPVQTPEVTPITEVNNVQEQPVIENAVEPTPQVNNEPVQEETNIPTIEKTTAQEAVENFVPVNDLFEEVQTVQLSSSNTVNTLAPEPAPQPVAQPAAPAQPENPFEQTIAQTPLSQMNPVNQVEEVSSLNDLAQPVQQANDLNSQVNDMKQNMDTGFEMPNTDMNSYQTETVNTGVVNDINNYQEPEYNPMNSEIDSQFENIELGNAQTDTINSIDSDFDTLDTATLANEPEETIQPLQNNNEELFNNFEQNNISDNQFNDYNEENTIDDNYEDLYASTVSSKRLQADNDNPQNAVTVDQQPSYNSSNEFEPQPSQNYGVGPQIDQTPQVEAYVPNDNRMQSIQTIEENRAYSTGSLSQVLTKDKKIVAFVGASKSGTSFLINNLATLFSSLGIRTAILDMTKNKNSYYIYTNNDENLRNIAYNCIENLENGIAEGIKVDRNLDVYTAIPNDGKDYSNSEPILSTLIQNESLVLIDCDFTTPWGYFANASEIYLVQSMDILTIQPLTAFLRELKTRGLLEQDKLRVVVNKELKVKGLSSKVIIGGMSFYNDPAMSFMTELFNKDRVKACTIPFDDNVYSKYLEQIVNCQITIGGYPKSFMNNLKILGNMVYPLLSKQTYSNNSGGQNYSNNGYNNSFSPEMNNTLNQMRNKY